MNYGHAEVDVMMYPVIGAVITDAITKQVVVPTAGQVNCVPHIPCPTCGRSDNRAIYFGILECGNCQHLTMVMHVVRN